MITFILGEDRHVKYFVHSIGQYDYFVIKDAKFSLLHNGKQEAAKKQDVHLRNRIKNCR